MFCFVYICVNACNHHPIKASEISSIPEGSFVPPFQLLHFPKGRLYTVLCCKGKGLVGPAGLPLGAYDAPLAGKMAQPSTRLAHRRQPWCFGE